MKEKKIIIKNQVVKIYQSSNFSHEKTLVFLHGWGQTGKTFEKIFQILEEKNVSFLSLDFAWFWETTLPDKNWNIENYGNSVINLLEKLNIKEPVIIGHSFGGRITIYIASFYKNIKKIILIGSAGIKKNYNPLYLALIKTGKLILNFPVLGRIRRLFQEKMQSRDYKSSWRMKQVFLNIIGNDLKKYMEKINFPTLLIRWEKDEETPLNEAQIINKKIKKSFLKVIPKGTHFVYQEFPEECVKFILDFIQKNNA